MHRFLYRLSLDEAVYITSLRRDIVNNIRNQHLRTKPFGGPNLLSSFINYPTTQHTQNRGYYIDSRSLWLDKRRQTVDPAPRPHQDERKYHTSGHVQKTYIPGEFGEEKRRSVHRSVEWMERGQQMRDGWKIEEAEHRAGFRYAWELARILLNDPEVPALLQNYGTETKHKILERMTKAEWRRLKEFYRPDGTRRANRCRLSNEERQELERMLEPVFERRQEHRNGKH